MQIYKDAVVKLHNFASDVSGNICRCTAWQKSWHRAKETDQKNGFHGSRRKQRSKCQIFCHGLITRTAVTVCPLHAKIKTAQQKALARSKQPLVQVTVCRACGTFRNKGLMSGTSRSSIGIQINLPVVDSSSFTCNGCGHSWGLCRVNLVGNALLTRPKLDAEKSGFICALAAAALANHAPLTACFQFAPSASKRSEPCQALALPARR